MTPLPAASLALVPEMAAGAVPEVRPQPLDRLPGTGEDDPFLRLVVGWLVGHPARTATAYRRDLAVWARWCDQLGAHPLAAEWYHVDAWVRHLTTVPSPRTERPASAATVARRLYGAVGLLRLRRARRRGAHPLPCGLGAPSSGLDRVLRGRPHG